MKVYFKYNEDSVLNDHLYHLKHVLMKHFIKTLNVHPVQYTTRLSSLFPVRPLNSSNIFLNNGWKSYHEHTIFYLLRKMAQLCFWTCSPASKAFFLENTTPCTTFPPCSDTLRMRRHNFQHFLQAWPQKALCLACFLRVGWGRWVRNKRTGSDTLIFVSCLLFTSLSHEPFFFLILFAWLPLVSLTFGLEKTICCSLNVFDRKL